MRPKTLQLGTSGCPVGFHAPPWKRFAISLLWDKPGLVVQPLAPEKKRMQRDYLQGTFRENAKPPLRFVYVQDHRDATTFERVTFAQTNGNTNNDLIHFFFHKKRFWLLLSEFF